MALATEADTRTDEHIQRDVRAELEWEARVRPNEIGAAVKNGLMTLTGWVDSYPKKWAAEEAAHRVRGVLAVANDTEVRLPGDAERAVRNLIGVTGTRSTLSGLKEKTEETRSSSRARVGDETWLRIGRPDCP
jgi:hypothetical protein